MHTSTTLQTSTVRFVSDGAGLSAIAELLVGYGLAYQRMSTFIFRFCMLGNF